MASVTEIRLIDDLDGGVADTSVQFALDGASFAIDLSVVNAEKLRGILTPYIEKARKIGGRATGIATQRKTAATPTANAERNASIRAWCAEVGVPIGDRGRISTDIVNAWENRGTNLGETMLNDLLPADRVAPSTVIEDGGPPSAREALDELEQARQAKQRATADPFTAEPSKGALNRDDITDAMIIVYRESKGLPVKLRKGQVPATYREAYYTAHGITG